MVAQKQNKHGELDNLFCSCPCSSVSLSVVVDLQKGPRPSASGVRGLADRWRKCGVGPVRASEISERADAEIFSRRFQNIVVRRETGCVMWCSRKQAHINELEEALHALDSCVSEQGLLP